MEIGGDFWQEDVGNRNNINKEFFEFGIDNYFVMSGRTAIDTALQDILKTKKIKNVYFPSYSCESMMKPFIDRNIKIDYYNVYFNENLKYDIDINYDCDIFFAMNYFGFTSTNMEAYINEFKKRDIIVIEDITHSLLSQKIFSKKSDYLVCSLRKWFPIISGGIISKINGNLDIDYNSFMLNMDVIKNKDRAMQMKLNSIIHNNYNENKNEYLSLYKKANNAIKEDYINKKIDDSSLYYLLNVDLDDVRRKRKENVNIIYQNLDLKKYKLLINDYNEKFDILLYVPIYMDKEKLKVLKEKIYQDKFYCPSHWPIDDNICDIYNRELSIICDQRYNTKDIIQKMNNFL